MVQDQYQTVREVADLLKVNQVTVRRWIRDGELRAIDIGKGWRIDTRDLDAFLEEHATRPGVSAQGRTSSSPNTSQARQLSERKA